jgi:hypothetical protein
VGTPDEQIHLKAHELEHVHDPVAEEYIDDILGHPVEDPHGKEIPEDPACRQPGVAVSLSRLRDGNRVKVVKSPTSGAGSEFQAGEVILTDKRQNGGKTWVVIKQNGQQVQLDHDTADSIMVECVYS